MRVLILNLIPFMTLMILNYVVYITIKKKAALTSPSASRARREFYIATILITIVILFAVCDEAGPGEVCCGTKSWSKTLSPMRVSGWFVIILAVGAWGGLVEAAAAPKVGLKPCLPCAFQGGL